MNRFYCIILFIYCFIVYYIIFIVCNIMILILNLFYYFIFCVYYIFSLRIIKKYCFNWKNTPQTIKTQTAPRPYIPESPRGRKSCSYRTKTIKEFKVASKPYPVKKEEKGEEKKRKKI